MNYNHNCKSTTILQHQQLQHLLLHKDICPFSQFSIQTTVAACPASFAGRDHSSYWIIKYVMGVAFKIWFKLTNTTREIATIEIFKDLDNSPTNHNDNCPTNHVQIVIVLINKSFYLFCKTRKFLFLVKLEFCTSNKHAPCTYDMRMKIF